MGMEEGGGPPPAVAVPEAHNTHTHTPGSSHADTGAALHDAPRSRECPENLIFPNTHQGSPSSLRDSARDN